MFYKCMTAAEECLVLGECGLFRTLGKALQFPCLGRSVCTSVRLACRQEDRWLYTPLNLGVHILTLWGILPGCIREVKHFFLCILWSSIVGLHVVL